ncbi:hypothetical protein VP01_2694g1 [Puccinia sorghi]|uniref:Uncharacterized protein n=1 Tax=Puccinia sorghi TaxID=27349 RepID=A0A0L6V3V9_9BASI|nr:hypothetical protein VP01_2694g1 [Puccinia sorghi]
MLHVNCRQLRKFCLQTSNRTINKDVNCGYWNEYCGTLSFIIIIIQIQLVMRTKRIRCVFSTLYCWQKIYNGRRKLSKESGCSVKVQQSVWYYSHHSPRVIQPSFDAPSLCRLHIDCAKTSTHANRCVCVPLAGAMEAQLGAGSQGKRKSSYIKNTGLVLESNLNQTTLKRQEKNQHRPQENKEGSKPYQSRRWKQEEKMRRRFSHQSGRRKKEGKEEKKKQNDEDLKVIRKTKVELLRVEIESDDERRRILRTQADLDVDVLILLVLGKIEKRAIELRMTNQKDWKTLNNSVRLLRLASRCTRRKRGKVSTIWHGELSSNFHLFEYADFWIKAVESLLEKVWSNNRSFLGVSACQLQAVEQVFFAVLVSDLFWFWFASCLRLKFFTWSGFLAKIYLFATLIISGTQHKYNKPHVFIYELCYLLDRLSASNDKNGQLQSTKSWQNLKETRGLGKLESLGWATSNKSKIYEINTALKKHPKRNKKLAEFERSQVLGAASTNLLSRVPIYTFLNTSFVNIIHQVNQQLELGFISANGDVPLLACLHSSLILILFHELVAKTFHQTVQKCPDQNKAIDDEGCLSRYIKETNTRLMKKDVTKESLRRGRNKETVDCADYRIRVSIEADKVEMKMRNKRENKREKEKKWNKNGDRVD